MLLGAGSEPRSGLFKGKIECFVRGGGTFGGRDSVLRATQRSHAAVATTRPPSSGIMDRLERSTIRVLFASKHPDRGASLVRGMQVAQVWRSSLMLSSPQMACHVLHAPTPTACAGRSRSLIVVHLKDISSTLFRLLPFAVHLLDPIDKIYRGWSMPSDRRLCGLVAHSAAQATLYRAETGVRRVWVVPDHGLARCAADDSDSGGHSGSWHSVFLRRTVLVLGGSPSERLRGTLSNWANSGRVAVLYEKDLRSNASFASSHGWEAWLCNALQRTASVAVAWDQISGLPFEAACTEQMGLTSAQCFDLKPAERFVVPLSAGVPTVGFAGYASFREAVGGTDADGLLASSIDGLLRHLTALTTDFMRWRHTRVRGRRVGRTHGTDVIRSTYERVRREANASCGR